MVLIYKLLLIINGGVKLLRKKLLFLELRRLRGEQPKAIDDELDQMYNELKLTAEDNSLSTILRNRSFLLPIFLVCIYQGGLQFTGTIAVSSITIIFRQKQFCNSLYNYV